MDDEVLVRVVHGRTCEAKELQAIGDGEPVAIAVDVQRLAVDQLHDEVRKAFGGCAAVKEAGDVWVIEACHDLALHAEAGQVKPGSEVAAHELDGDGLQVVIVGADGTVDDAHAAGADLLDELVGADATAYAEGLACGVGGLRGAGERRVFEKAGRVVIGEDEAVQVVAKLSFLAGCIDEGGPLLRGKSHDLVEQLADVPPLKGLRHTLDPVTQLVLEPCFGAGPLPLNGGWRDAEDGGALLLREATEESHLDDATSLRVEFAQSIKRLVQREDVDVLLP